MKGETISPSTSQTLDQAVAEGERLLYELEELAITRQLAPSELSQRVAQYACAHLIPREPEKPLQELDDHNPVTHQDVVYEALAQLLAQRRQQRGERPQRMSPATGTKAPPTPEITTPAQLKKALRGLSVRQQAILDFLLGSETGEASLKQIHHHAVADISLNTARRDIHPLMERGLIVRLQEGSMRIYYLTQDVAALLRQKWNRKSSSPYHDQPAP